MSIEKYINSLTVEQQKELFCAFNMGKSHVVFMNKGEFIGVHIPDNTHLNIIKKEGYWCYGREDHSPNGEDV
jgi:hypothetical protein